jgi:tight adherence protein B
MRVIELMLFGIGSLFLSIFAISSVYPYAANRLESIAERRSVHLKDDFLWMSSRKLLLVFTFSGICLGAVAFLLTRNAMTSLALTLTPVLFSGLAVKRYRKRRTLLIIRQLPAFLDTLSGYIKAGHSFPEAVASAIPLLPGGIREEISWLSRLNRLGTPLPDAFLAWEIRMPSPEVSLVARPMRIALSTGGNIVSLLERARDVLRARQRQQDKLRSMTAQARLQAIVLTMLPPIFLAVLSRMEDGFLEAILNSGPGRMILLSAALLQFIGWLFIRNILSVKI